MAKETKKYDEGYLNGLIAKAKKSWEGVDVESYMSDLRDMDAVTIKCRDLMVGDWCCDQHGFTMQITNVGDDYAYATWDDNEGYPWEFDDKGDQPCAIEITDDMFIKNNWEEHSYPLPYNLHEYYYMKDEGRNHLIWKQGRLSIWFDYEKCNDGVYADIIIPVKYVHQLQQVLRLAGLTEMANNFKV